MVNEGRRGRGRGQNLFRYTCLECSKFSSCAPIHLILIKGR